jgi:hypothetical protein
VWEGYLGAGDGTERRELLPQPLVVEAIVQILDVQVDPLVAGHTVLLHLLKLAFQLRLALSLLLGSAHVDLSPVEILPVHLVYSLRT